MQTKNHNLYKMKQCTFSVMLTSSLSLSHTHFLMLLLLFVAVAAFLDIDVSSFVDLFTSCALEFLL